MKSFHTVAVPHKDILEGRLTMDVFAADLWEVSQNRGPDEYRNAEIFFQKTYFTEGLKNLLNVVEKRLKGKGGDPVIQIQTPFGGGKTHALIAMYHKAKEWGAKKVVIVGTSLSPDNTLWGILEQQLSGRITKFKDKISPGREAIRELLIKNQPLLILMDEVLEYITKAAGVKVGESTLAAQTMAFIQELTETLGTIEKGALIITLPSSIIEHYDETAEKFYQQLQKVAGRLEKIYTPVQDYEVTKIIRQRLFSNLDETEYKKIITKFIEYSERENILPPTMETSEYRERFIASYPFLPEVIDVLYHRWGSFPTFQRTRGVLRLLSLVVYSLKNSNIPYISLADFDLSNQEIRQELIKHIGTDYNSIIAQDITDKDAGAKKIDKSLGKAYQGLKPGTRAATAIFMYSFSGGAEHGATLREIKLSATTMENPASVIAEALEQLKNKLFFLQYRNEKYFFNNQPNLNRIILIKMENIKEEQIEIMEKEILKNNVKSDKLKTFIWEENSSNIPDNENMKLIILKNENKDVIKEIIQNKGKTPRVYRNTLFFLCPVEYERAGFINLLRRKLAYKSIEQDNTLKLTKEQSEEIKKEIKRLENELGESIRKLYRKILIPEKDGLKEIDMGTPVYGETKTITDELYDTLCSEGVILDNIAPIVIKEKYLKNKDYVFTEQLYQYSLKTPGETRYINKGVLEKGISDGVLLGIFGLGELENDKVICRYFKCQPDIGFSGKEILIKDSICEEQFKKEVTPGSQTPPFETKDTPGEKTPENVSGGEGNKEKLKEKVVLKFRIPRGKIANLMGVMNFLQSKFENLELELIATGGAISEQDYEDKIMEAFRQIGVKLETE